MFRITTIVLPWMVFLVVSLKATIRNAFVVPSFSSSSRSKSGSLMKFVPFAKFALAAGKIPVSSQNNNNNNMDEIGEDGKLKGWEYLPFVEAKKHNPKLSEDYTDNEGIMWHYICEGISNQTGKKIYRRRRVVKMVGDDGNEKVYEVTEGDLDWEAVDPMSMQEVTIDPKTGEAHVTDEEGNVWAYTTNDESTQEVEWREVDDDDIAKYNPNLNGVIVDENGEQWRYFIDEEAVSNSGMEWVDVNEDDMKENNPELNTIIRDKNGEDWMYIEESI